MNTREERKEAMTEFIVDETLRHGVDVQQVGEHICQECGLRTRQTVARSMYKMQLNGCPKCGLVTDGDRVISQQEFDEFMAELHPRDIELAAQLGLTMHCVPINRSESN